jgi:hypothetical protein
MGEVMMGIGRKIKCMERESTLGKMDENMKETTY